MCYVLLQAWRKAGDNTDRILASWSIYSIEEDRL